MWCLICDCSKPTRRGADWREIVSAYRVSEWPQRARAAGGLKADGRACARDKGQGKARFDPAQGARKLVAGKFASGALSKTPAQRPSKDSRGSYAETQYSALGLPSVFLGFVIGCRCQVIGNSEVIRWIHIF